MREGGAALHSSISARLAYLHSTCPAPHGWAGRRTPLWPLATVAAFVHTCADVEDFYKKTDPKPLIFCHFASGSGERVYGEMADFKRLTRTLTEVHWAPL